MLDMGILPLLKRAGVKLSLDRIFCLRPYLPLETALRGREVLHPIRTLAELRMISQPDGTTEFRFDDPVAEVLADWHRSSRDDFNKIASRLETIALNRNIENIHILKQIRHPDAREIFEVVGNRDHARVFVFYDPSSGNAVVGAGSYWKLGRSHSKEHKKQDAAILNAAARQRMWLLSAVVPGLKDWRFLREGKQISK